MFFSKKKKKNWKSLTDSVSEKILNAFTYITDGEDITDIQLLEIKEEVTSGDSREEEQREVIVWYSKQSRGKEIILLLAAIKIEFSWS